MRFGPLAAALALALLAGCSTGGKPSSLGETLLSLAAGGEPAEVSPRYRRLQGQPAQLVSVEATGVNDALLLESVSASGAENWLARNAVMFSMQQGMLVATRGLGNDLMAADASESAALIHARQPGQAHRFYASLSGENDIQHHSYVCDIAVVQPYDLDLFTRVVPTSYMTETCYAPEGAFTNYYWVGRSDGRIWQSRQQAGSVNGLIAFRWIDPALVSIQ